MEYAFIALAALVMLLFVVVLVRAAAFRAKAPATGEPARIQSDADAAARRLAGAIRFRTIAHPDQGRIDGSQFRGLHEHLRASYPGVASKLAWEVVKDYSLLLTWRGKGGSRPVALLAHMDVVPVNPGTEADWQHDAFSGHIDDTQVWGRGTMDMKGHLICVLEAVEALLSEGFQPQSDVYLCFGHNEETGGDSGAWAMAELLRARGVKLDMVIDEGGAVMPGRQMLGMDGLVGVVGTAEKGYMDVRLSCTQDGGHSSQPPASTALGILAGAVTRLEANPAKPKLIASVRGMLIAAGRRMGFLKRLVFANLWLTEPLVLKALAAKPLTSALVRTTFAATMASGSPAPNVLPQRAEVVVNIRLMPGEDMQDELARLRRAVGDSRVAVELIGGKNPSKESPVDTTGYRLIKAQLEEMYPGVIVAPYLMIGGTDAYRYQQVCDNIYRIAPFLIGPETLKTVHGTNERISKENLLRGAAFFKGILSHC